MTVLSLLRRELVTALLRFLQSPTTPAVPYTALFYVLADCIK